jgi:hypothetical protein
MSVPNGSQDRCDMLHALKCVGRWLVILLLLLLISECRREVTDKSEAGKSSSSTAKTDLSALDTAIRGNVMTRDD